MKKLTPQEKAARKAAQKVRDRAFTERYRAFRKERDAAESAAKQSAEYAQYEEAKAAFERAEQERDDELARLDGLIRELQEKRAKTADALQQALNVLHGSQSRAFDRFRDEEKRLVAEVVGKYPDMDGCFYAAAWKPTPEVQAAMDAAYAEALAQPAAEDAA